MEFRTIVNLPPAGPRITPATRALILGSCFAEHIGARLNEALGSTQCCVNPFGVLYNPESIAQAIELLTMPLTEMEAALQRALFEGRDALWHSWLHSTKFSAESREECENRCRTTMLEARQAMEMADVIIVTFGTDHAYLLRDASVVANCHKELANTFSEKVYTNDEISVHWSKLQSTLMENHPGRRIIYTVSPYRYRKYGFHNSQLSKAHLLLAVDQLVNASPPNEGACYFPAYEIVLDELRDYRFFDSDMLHPSPQAVAYVWERFREWTFTPEMTLHYQQRLKEIKALNHHVNH